MLAQDYCPDDLAPYHRGMSMLLFLYRTATLINNARVQIDEGVQNSAVESYAHQVAVRELVRSSDKIFMFVNLHDVQAFHTISIKNRSKSNDGC